MLKFDCPHCRHSHTIKQPKAGRFRPSCSKCKQPFDLAIAADLVKFEVKGLSASVAPQVTPAATSSGSANSPAKPSRVEPAPARSSELNQTRNDPQPTTTPLDNSVTREVSAGDAFVSAAAIAAGPVQQMGTQVAERLGGYRLLKELGRGGLGVVYLAQQLSLNRRVAIKLIQSKLASSTTAISRFFREAYAAAQLVHHNVVQIYDLGEDNGTNFFSMEYVQGKNLAEVIQQEGPLEPRRAASYILQAARGLQFAHSQGMVHRDIKPANLMLDQHGVVKVADLGLVKLPATADEPIDQRSGEGTSGSIQLTGVGATVGTVNYIAPEQAVSSSDVDHRADIYSLGCTFFMLLTGSPPFRGKSAQDILHNHKTAPVPRPETIAPKVDRQISDIVQKMMQKRPDDRYANLGLLVNDLQRYLGIQAGGGFSPTQQQVQLLESSQKAYYGQSLVSARAFMPWAFLGLGLVAVAATLLFGYWNWSLAILWGLFVAPLTAILVAGLRQQSRVFDRVRELVYWEGIPLWLKFIFGGLLTVTLVYLLGIVAPWLLMTAFGVILGLGYVFTIEQGLVKEREAALQPVQQLLRNERVAGMDEESLQRFVAKYSGSDWEEYFEDLFGYDALRRARMEYVDPNSGPRKKRFRPWRDRIIDRVEARLQLLRRKRDAAKLQKIEERALLAGGVPAPQAAAEANAMAEMMVQEAAQWRNAALSPGGQLAADPQAAANAKRARIKAMLAEARSGANRKPPSLIEKLEAPLDLFLGAHVRLILGTLLIVGCALWIQKSEVLSHITLASLEQAAKSVQEGNANLTEITSQTDLNKLKQAAPLGFPVFGPMVSNLNAGIGGLLLVASVFFGGWRATAIVLPLALIVWLFVPRILV